MIPEKRKHPRLQILQLVALSFGRETFIDATCLNLSEGGLYCEVHEFIEPHTRFFMMLSFPDTKPGDEIKCDGIVVRSEKKNDQYFIAIEFIDLGDHDMDILKKHIINSL